MTWQNGDAQFESSDGDNEDRLEGYARIGAGVGAVLLLVLLLASLGYAGFVIAETWEWIDTGSLAQYQNYTVMDRVWQTIAVTVILVLVPLLTLQWPIRGMAMRVSGNEPSYRARYRALKPTLTVKSYDLGVGRLDLRRPTFHRAIRWGSPFGIRWIYSVLSWPFRSVVLHLESGRDVWQSSHWRLRFSEATAIQHRVAELGIGPAILFMTSWNGQLFLLRRQGLVLMYSLCAEYGLQGFRSDDPLVAWRIHAASILAYFTVLGRGERYRKDVVAEIEAAVVDRRVAQGLSGDIPRTKHAVLLPDTNWPIPTTKHDG